MYLYADFFDLLNEKWSKELQNKVLEQNIPAQEDLREMIASSAAQAFQCRHPESDAY